MHRFLITSIFLLVSCDSPEPYSEEWFEKGLTNPNSEYSQEFKVLAKGMSNDQELKEKYSIATLLMTDTFLNQSSVDQYLKSLQICAANFSVMYGFMEAGIEMGETITGLTDTDERDYFYNQYINKAYITEDHSSEFLKFKFTWELPLFEELYGTVLEEHLEYGIRTDLHSDVLEYEGVIEDCETLCSDGYLEGYDDPLITFHTKEYKIEDIGITDVLEKQSISRKNNIVSVYWEFKKIYKNQEIYDVRFNHDTLKQCVHWSGW